MYGVPMVGSAEPNVAVKTIPVTGGEHARDDEGDDPHRDDVDAGGVGRANVAADREQIAAIGCLAEQPPRDRDQDEDEDHARHAQMLRRKSPPSRAARCRRISAAIRA